MACLEEREFVFVLALYIQGLDRNFNAMNTGHQVRRGFQRE